MTALSTRPQQKQPEPDGSSRYDQRGLLWVKHGGAWMTFGRYAAVKFLERREIRLPKSVRVELADATRPATVHNLVLKFRGKQERVRVIDYAKRRSTALS